jgi:hypothetical protein
LVRQFGDEFEFDCDLWRFDVLGLPEPQEAVAWAGHRANLIIVADRCEADLPPPVKDWLNWCVDRKTPGSAALVALLESQRRLSDVQCRTRQFLQHVAVRGGLEFFLQEADFPQTRLELNAEVLGKRANTVSFVLEGILHRGEAPSRWRAEE